MFQHLRLTVSWLFLKFAYMLLKWLILCLTFTLIPGIGLFCFVCQLLWCSRPALPVSSEFSIGRSGHRSPSFRLFLRTLLHRILTLPYRVACLDFHRFILCFSGFGKGYCYAQIFPFVFRPFLRLVLGPCPTIGAIDFVSCFIPADWSGFIFTFDRIWHISYGNPTHFTDPAPTMLLGMEQAGRPFVSGYFATNASNSWRDRRNVASDHAQSGFRHSQFRSSGNGKGYTTHQPNVTGRGEAVVVPKRKLMSAASALASFKALFNGEAITGAETFSERVSMAVEEFGDKAILTSINPSSKLFRKLIEALRMPLQYVPGIKGHDAAGTARRAWMSKMIDETKYAQVGMISPSIVEWHHHPDAVAYYFNPERGVDPSRMKRNCNMCQSKSCKVLEKAEADGRVAVGPLQNAIVLFKKMDVDYLWMVNIEPNMPSSDILLLMNKAGIEQGYSAAHIDWHVLENGSSFCAMTEQETSIVGDKVVSKFADSGAYIQDLKDVKAMFAPVFCSGNALRRTVVGRAGTSMLMELQVDHSGYGTNFVPDRQKFYLIPIPHPTRGSITIKVEKSGFDRVMQTFRTTANRTVEAARVQLRQSNVTYSVSGTALTPRLELNATDSELLAIWMTSYSIIMDTLVEVATDTINIEEGVEILDGKISSASRSLFSTVMNSIKMSSASKHPQLASHASVKKWLMSCELDGRFLTLQQISDAEYDRIYGESFALSTSANIINAKWGLLKHKIPTFGSSMKYIQDLTATTWKHGFTVADIFARALIMTECVTAETMGFTLDIATHIARVLRVNTRPIDAVKAIVDNRHTPYAKIWKSVVEAQELGFQAASIQIVETVYLYSLADPTVLELVNQEHTSQLAEERLADMRLARDNAELRERNKTMADIPYLRVLTEIKNFLASFNTRAARIAMISATINAKDDLQRRNARENKAALDKFVEDLKDLAAGDVEEISPPTTSAYALSQQPVKAKPIPIHGVYQVTRTVDPATHAVTYPFNAASFKGPQVAFLARDTVNIDRFDNYHAHPFVQRDAADERILAPVPTLPDGTLDFRMLEDPLTLEFPEFCAEQADPQLLAFPPLGRSVSYPPNAFGARFLKNIALCYSWAAETLAPVTTALTAPFAEDDVVLEWIESRSAATDIPAVRNAIKGARNLLQNPRVPYIMHIEGLAMGGKSAGLRNWLTKEDCVVVSSNELKDQWQESLGRSDPVHRASVFTQHTALKMDCARFVIVDEAYTFETPHLELLRRFPSAKGFITIGDGHQIDDVFAEDTLPTLNPRIVVPAITAIAPVSFCPFDALVTYLRCNTSQIVPECYYYGSKISTGLYYEIEQDQVVIPSAQDLSINGTQAAKQNLRTRGVTNSITAHESQGSRSEVTFIHSVERFGACKDMGFLAANNKHFGVAITRARQATIFIFRDSATARILPWFLSENINGCLPTDILFSGTSFDLVDPVTSADVVYERATDLSEPLTDVDQIPINSDYTVGAFINEEVQEAIALEEISLAICEVEGASLVNTHHQLRAPTDIETFIFNPSHAPGGSLINMLERKTPPTKLRPADFDTADKIISRLFDCVIDPHMFFKLVALERDTISRKERKQVIEMALSKQSSHSDVSSRAFGKNELAKKVMVLGGGMKCLSVSAMNQTQLMLFADAVDTLGCAWTRSLRDGIMSPSGFTQPEVAKKLGSMSFTYEADIESQDSNHANVHVCVLVLLIAIVAKRLGFAELAEEIRSARSVGDMEGHIRFRMGTGLGSGDAWTLIANKIMAFSALVSRYFVPKHVSILQTGDDITVGQFLREYPLGDPMRLPGSDNVRFKIDNRCDGLTRPTFISATSVNDHFSVAKRIRGLLKMVYRPRNRAQHIAYKVEAIQLKKHIAEFGIVNYCDMHSSLFDTDPSFLEQLITRAYVMADTEFDLLPENLRTDVGMKVCTIFSRDHACFGYALAHAVGTNIQAVNALATYTGSVDLVTAVDACIANGVPYVVFDKPYSTARGSSAVCEHYIERGVHQPTVYLFEDHAVCAKSITSEIVAMGGNKKFKIDLMTEDVEEIDFFV